MEGSIGIAAGDARPAWLEEAWSHLLRRRMFMLLVVVPTLLVAAYYFLFAADQYESEADFVVKTAAQASGGSGTGMAQLFGWSGLTSLSQAESYSVDDFLLSHDAVTELRRRFDLIAMFRRPEADWLARLWSGEPTAEYLLKYFRRQVKVTYDEDTGITRLRVHAFRPGDARTIALVLLDMGEKRVNLINARALENGLAVAERQLRQAEAGVAQAQDALTRQRLGGRDIDPSGNTTAQMTLLAGLEQQLAESRAGLAAMARAVRPDSPQYVAQVARIRALEAQTAAQRDRMTGPGDALAPRLGAYESLKLRQDFAAKRYETAAAAYEAAREQILKQQLYVVRNVEPNLPEKSLYPQRWLITASVFFGLLLAYGVGWLVLAGVREHAQ